ncbi:MAG: hypothetical protein JWR54_2061 [Mucilaginibacter sp.]|nr:hypothetical protein [Mucilaginibacter sp.]
MVVILLPQSIYEQFSACPADTLEEEISRTSIRLRLQAPVTDEQRRLYQLELDRLSGLKYLSQFRKGRLSQDDFNSKVELY